MRSKLPGPFRALSVLAIALAGVMLVAGVSPGAAKPLTKKKALKLFYTKAQADEQFVNVGEKAGDADKLDGQDSSAFGQLATVNRTASCPGSGFYPEASSHPYTTSVSGGGVEHRRHTSATQVIELHCPVNLPQGAVITGVRLVVFDGGNTSPDFIGPCHLRRIPATGVPAVLAATGNTSSAFNSGVTTLDDTTITSPVVPAEVSHYLSCDTSNGPSVGIVMGLVDHQLIDVPVATP